MIEKSGKISVRQQCILLQITRSNLFYRKKMPTRDSTILDKINKIQKYAPMYGYRKVTHGLKHQGVRVNSKQIQRVMQKNGLKALQPKKIRNLSKNPKRGKEHFLLKDVKIQRVNQAWSTDISYIKMPHGFVYLAAIIDVYSRKILGHHISTSLDTDLCIQALNNALKNNDKPEVLNTDQGCQYTSEMWINAVKSQGIQLSMDGKGRWADNVYMERTWRTIKQESVFIHKFQTVSEVKREISEFIKFYNYRRLHENLGYETPDDVYNGKASGREFVYAHLTNPSR